MCGEADPHPASRHLVIHLNDHLAGSLAGLEMARPGRLYHAHETISGGSQYRHESPLT
jgi:hypothetical protein